MTPRRDWPKADLLHQRRLALGLPLEPAPAPPLLSLVIKGSIGALVLVMLTWLALFGLQYRQQLLQAEIDALLPVEKRVGDAKAQLRAISSRRSALDQQTQSIAEQLVAVRSGSALLEQLRRVTPKCVRLVSVDAHGPQPVAAVEGTRIDQGPTEIRLSQICAIQPCAPEVAAPK